MVAVAAAATHAVAAETKSRMKTNVSSPACNNMAYNSSAAKKYGSLYIMRHGRTDWNNLKKLQGRTDIPLNEEGRIMAQKAQEEYKNVHFDVCYCSPLIRARETAQLLLKDRNIPVIIDERLIEMSFGVFEGVEKAYENPECQMYSFFTDPEHYKEPEGGESFKQLFKRTGDFLNDVVYKELQKGKDILIVGHGAMNSSIICQVKNIPLANFWDAGIENCKLKKLI